MKINILINIGKKFNNIIDQKGIKVIYILETYPDELEFLNLKELIQNQCFEKKKRMKVYI